MPDETVPEAPVPEAPVPERPGPEHTVPADRVDEWGEESFPASDAATGWQGPEEDVDALDRLEEVVDGAVGFVTFRRTPGRLVLEHTEVPESMGGRGVGGRLVERVVDLAIAEGRTLVPRCPFARHWLSQHHDVRDRVAIDWHLHAG